MSAAKHVVGPSATDAAYDHVWRWRTRAGFAGERHPHPLADRAGQPCRVLVRGRMGSVLVEFPDGLRVVAARYAVRRAS